MARLSFWLLGELSKCLLSSYFCSDWLSWGRFCLGSLRSFRSLRVDGIFRCSVVPCWLLYSLRSRSRSRSRGWMSDTLWCLRCWSSCRYDCLDSITRDSRSCEGILWVWRCWSGSWCSWRSSWGSWGSWYSCIDLLLLLCFESLLSRSLSCHIMRDNGL